MIPLLCHTMVRGTNFCACKIISEPRLRRIAITHLCATGQRSHRAEVEVAGLNRFAQAASLAILAEYERTAACVEALGALNRWPGRSGVPIHDYLQQWEASCAELQASPLLPARLRELLRIPEPRG
jgi:hypothetical protein